MSNNDIQLQVNETIISGKDILEAIDPVIHALYDSQDTSLAERAMIALAGVQEVAGLSLAKLLYHCMKWYGETEQEESTGDNFYDWIYSVSARIAKWKVDRYTSVWEKHELGLFPKEIRTMDMKDQIVIAGTIDQGHEITKKQFEKLAAAANNNEVHEICRKIKGKKPSKASLRITLDREGKIYVYYRGERFYKGYLVPPSAAESELEREALEKAGHRIVHNTGIMER